MIEGVRWEHYADLGREIGELVAAKQAQYGDSFGDCPKLLAILYPNGIRPDQYQDVLTVVRMLDKLKRIATRHESDTESPYVDLMGYALLAEARERGL